MPAAYKLVDGKQCEVELLELGAKLSRERSLTLEAARSIWANALDGNKITERERNSINYIIKSSPHGLTDDATEFFQYWLHERSTSKLKGGKLETVDGVKCDSAMMQVAKHFQGVASGPLDIRAAEGIWFSALDGRGVTTREKDTIALILRKHEFEGAAKSFLESKVSWLSIAADVATDTQGKAPLPDFMLLARSDALALEDLPPPPLPPPSTPPPLFASSSVAAPAPLLLPADGVRQGQISTLRNSSEPLSVLSKAISSCTKRARAMLSGTASTALQLGDAGQRADQSAEPPAKRRRPESPTISLERLRAVFDKCDSDKDGKVNKREFIKACREDANIACFFELPGQIRQEDGSRNKFEELFQGIDVDGDREICWAELLAHYRHRISDF
eukprot:gb/GFBE01039458.1/.p1 GENE.gb/GFBE01039458.1/~~gb/GFBE01039458.1/.p1  ORF type:complete len:390 (+),score=95.11 gb/GFBE01039458.1/:1-1170(+)